ncbi:cell wall surface anchor family protein [Haemophilus haemolyticus M19107]|nr:cell wall surface anchor family protein [Haemophilus haemolyticus M19107]
MSKNISVKINNGNKTIETVKLNSANQKVIIKAQPHVNYELVDEATQYAPEMIDTKRVGNDLHIAFEGTDINKESDLVLEGYYEHDNTELVLGMAEDGQYYAYVPQSGVESDAVTLLADQVFAPQALGGNSVTAPFWAFNPNWLWVAAGVAAVGGIIAAASGSHGGSSSNNAADKPSDNNAKDTTAPAKPTVEAKDNGSVDVTPPADADTKSVEVNYTDEAGTPKTATLTKGNDGNWTSNNPDVAVDPVSGKATIPADKVKDGSLVTAKATDTAGNTGEEGTANAGNNLDTTAPAKPTVEAKMNGFVYITPPADEDTKSVEVRYTDEKGNPQTVTITKDADKGWVSSNPNDDIWLNSETGKITLLAHKVKGDSLVKASATDNQGNTGEEATANAVNVTDTYGPSAPDSVSLQDRAIGVILPKYSNVGDSVVIKAGTYAKNRVDNSWGGSNENDFIETVATLTKQQDGSWISDKPENVPHVDAGNNRAIVTADKLKGFEFLNIDATDPSGHSIGFVQGWSDTSYSPEITVKTDGFMKITPPAVQDLKSMEVKYTDEAGTVKFTTLTRGEDGNWTSDNPDVTVEPATGNAMISVDKIQDTSSVYARTITNSDMGSNWSSRMVDKNPDTRPSAPEVIPSTKDGSVTVKVPDDAKVGDIVQVEIFPETKGVFWDSEYYFDMPITMNLIKNADGSWSSTESGVVPYPDSPSPAILPRIPAGQNSTTIPQDRVKDGYEVTAKTIDSAGHQSARVTAQAGKRYWRY